MSLAFLCPAIVVPQARGQLAITEVMSDWRDPQGQERPDFWELTNFGPEPIDISDYRFRDTNLPDSAVHVGNGVAIAAGESILFVRRRSFEHFDEATFCGWWGLDPCPRIFFFDLFGFSPLGEELWLWDASANVVDHVTFGEARPGITFTYETNCGRFGELSELDVCGAFRATDSDGIGSPGRAPCGPVPLAIKQQPSSQTNDAGRDVTFRLETCGLPRPRVQWFFNGLERSSSPGVSGSIPTVVNYAGSGVAWTAVANAGDLTILRATPADAGQYFAVLDNGLEKATSAVVTLVVNTNRAPPQIESPSPELRWPFVDGRLQTNLVVTPGQTATFGVIARSYPPASFEWSWSSDGIEFTLLPGETTNTLTIPSAQAADAGRYRVHVANELGFTNVFADLTVKAKPRLKITEAMSASCDPQGPDWWELTNVGEEPVDLYGYRWDDAPGDIGGGPTITNVIAIRPGESIIFLEDKAKDAFLRWWGEENLPTHLKVILHSANGLTETGDEINLWNPTATDPTDLVDTVVFSTATPGASFWFDPDVCSASTFPEDGRPSRQGSCGAFQAANGCDVGSPGWTKWTPPELTSVRREGARAVLNWKAQPGSSNRLQFTRQLASVPTATSWEDLGTYQFPQVTGTAVDSTIGAEAQRFYRVVRVAPADCLCPPDLPVTP